MNSKYIWICSIAFAAGIFISLWTLLSPDPENASFPHEPLCEIARQIRYGFTVKNTTDRPVRNASLCVYAPVDKTSTQRVKGVETSHPHDLSVDCLGIGVLHFPLKPIAPYRTRVITIYIVSPYGDASVQIDTWSRVGRISVEQGEAASLPDHHGKRFALPVEARSVTAVCRHNGTVLSLNAGNGVPVEMECSANGDHPGSVRFDARDNGTIPAGSYIESTHPVHMIMDAADGFATERNILDVK